LLVAKLKMLAVDSASPILHGKELPKNIRRGFVETQDEASELSLLARLIWAKLPSEEP
jgi:hypothetical protein